jgi:type VI secretion system protein ImpF
MSRDDSEQALMPSILDRLVDSGSQGTSSRPWYDLSKTMETVQHDLNDLLNTRRTDRKSLDGFPELRHSLLAYGLPELHSLDAFTSQQRGQISKVIEDAVTEFEPRLKDVRAVLLEGDDAKDHTVPFRIEARLRVEPAPDVAFNIILELTTGQYCVETTSS